MDEPVVPQDQPQDPTYSNDDLKKDFREIAENTELPVETPVTPETPEVPAAPEIDPVKLAEDAARKVLDEQDARARADAEAIKAEEVKTPDEKVYEEWASKFNKDNERQPTYLEAMEFVETRAVAKIEAKQAEAARVAQEQKEANDRKIQEDTQKINAVVDDELEDLYKGNKLTRVKDPTNPNDQGALERKSLFAKWAEVNQERRTKGLPDILSATRIAEFYWQKPNSQPAGNDAPIAGNRGSATPPSSEQEYSYKDIKKPWRFFK